MYRPELSTSTLLKLVSFLFWSGLYLWCSSRYPKQSPEWRSRAVTLLHGTVSTIVGLTQCGVTTISEWTLSMKIQSHHYALMLWSWGYFAFDLLWCLTYWKENKLMLLHHTSALIAIYIYMHKDYTGCTFACNLAMMEITNPLLQTRWFLRNEGYDNTWIYFLIEATYLVLFIAVRGILGTYVVYKIGHSDLFDMDEKVISVVFYFVSLAFIYEIIGYIAYRYKPKIVSKFKTVLEFNRLNGMFKRIEKTIK